MDLIEKAKAARGALERTFAGLPGVKGYKEKELRREADKTVRELLARDLDEQRQRLQGLQVDLLGAGGLQWVDDVERAVTKLQTLGDRIKTASYGYAPLFDDVKVKEAQLDALAQFDEQMVERVGALQAEVDKLAAVVSAREGIGDAANALADHVAMLNTVWGHRQDAILNS
ncbi:MAG: hypothetical protein WBV59_18120 [Anaerolineae bacterium]